MVFSQSCRKLAVKLDPVLAATGHICRQLTSLAGLKRPQSEPGVVHGIDNVPALQNPVSTRVAKAEQLYDRQQSHASASTSLPKLQHSRRLPEGPSLQAFLAGGQSGDATLEVAAGPQSGKLVYIETYGCQMNVNDSEVVNSVLAADGYGRAATPEAADVILLNTCSIRERAEAKIWSRLGVLKALKSGRQASNASGPVVGVLGCMAERLKEQLLDSKKLADVVAGPDAYRDLPRLLAAAQGNLASGKRSGGAMSVQLSLEETYADITPLRPAGTRSAFLSIMRGCNNMCSFCIVPYTRGRERSRPLASILDEVRLLSESGVKEVTLLGQNVNSYADFSRVAGWQAPEGDPFAIYAQGFRSVYKPMRGGAVRFAELLDAVADVDPEMRIWFTSPHPKDFSDEVLQVINSRPNICKMLHMPAQSGSSRMLEAMRRGYTREAYDSLAAHIRASIPQVTLSTDLIVGFCGETEADHQATLDLLRTTGYDQAFLFAYSRRDKTHAARHLEDDVPPKVKKRRLNEAITLFRERQAERNQLEIGRYHLVLVEGVTKDGQDFFGRTCSMKNVKLPDVPVPSSYTASASNEEHQIRLQPGDYVAVRVAGASTGTLFGEPLARTKLQEFVSMHGSTVPPLSARLQAGPAAAPAVQAAACGSQ